ncbi:MAG: Calx-beta domain-containing protein, partial [Chthoniobacteraceae bacterium]
MNLSLIEPLEARIAPAALSISPASVVENDEAHAISFTVSLDAPAPSTVSVQFATADGTAQAGDADYTTRTGTLTFAIGETEQLVTIQVGNDTKFEADETFVVNLSNAVGASIATGQATGTIQNDDTAPEISISDLHNASIAEGNSGTKTGTFSVTLSEAAGVPVTVRARSVDGTAVAGEDFEAIDQVITFAPGETSVSLPVTITGDTTDEADEMFTVELSNPSDGTIDVGSGQATILNDDRVVTIGDATIVEGDSGTQNLVFTVTLDAISDHAVMIDYATVNGTAVQNGDFVPVSGTLTFDPGQLTKEITVVINGDTTGEADETFTVSLSNAKNVLVADATGLGTIINDDATLTIGDASVVEGSGNMVFTVTLSGANAGETITVDYQTADVTAVSTGTVALGTLDYTPAGGSIMLTADANGNATGTIPIEVLNDSVSESTTSGTTVTNERFHVTITSADVPAIAKTTGIGTIIDDEGTFITINDVTVTETDTATANARFTVSLNRPALTAVSVAYATEPGTAVSSGTPSDFVARNGTLNFAVGQQFLFIDVPVNGDTIREITEQFTVNLSNATNAAIGDASGQASIVDNDPVPTVTVANGTIVEGNDGTTQLVLVASLSQPNEAETVTVAYSTINGTGAAGAMAGSDFAGVTNGLITFAPGQTSASIMIDVVGDSLVEANETFQVQLTNPQNAILGAAATATATIGNDDISASIANVTFTEGAAGETVQNVTVTLSAAPVAGSTVTVNYAVASGTATAGTDYRLSDPALSPLVFAAGEITRTISFIVLGDALDENDETISVSLTGVTGGILGEDKTATVTIADDDPEPTISIADAVLVEGNSGTANMVFTVSLSGASAKPISVTASTLAGTALSGVDFTQIDGRVINFAAGDTSKTFSVSIVGDTFDELDETFSVELSSATNATIADGTAVGTIIDNDNSVVTIANAAGAEGTTGQTSPFVFTVSVPNPTPTDIVVSYATSNGTATAGTDYMAATGTVTIPAGQTSATISINVTGDNTLEPDENFTVTLSNPTGGAVLGQATATGTIQTDEISYKLMPVTDTAAEETGGVPGQVTYKVVRAGADLSLTGSVNFTTEDNGSAVSNVDYVAQSGALDFAAGETEKTITIDFKSDNARENSETFLVQLTGSTNGVLLDSSNMVQTTLSVPATITDNDAAPVISISSPTVVEGNPDTNGSTPDLTDLV